MVVLNAGMKQLSGMDVDFIRQCFSWREESALVGQRFMPREINAPRLPFRHSRGSACPGFRFAGWQCGNPAVIVEMPGRVPAFPLRISASCLRALAPETVSIRI